MFPLNITSLLGRELLVMVYNQIFTINSARKTAQETKKKDESDFSVVISRSTEES